MAFPVFLDTNAIYGAGLSDLLLILAERGGAAVIATFNLKHFPTQALASYQVGCIHPDNFLLDQLDLFPTIVAESVTGICGSYEHPPVTLAEFCDLLRRSGVPRFAAALTPMV
ncbi:MAG: hypothetical protein FWF75_01645 [Propionibacteriaceae bacterium]|nr:hypothetical protein [Propionibacteriaceae bacterium]